MKYRTLAEGTQIKAILDAAETAPALGKGQPVVVTKWPADTTVEPYTVKTCPDGQVPDYVVGRTAVSGSPGDILYVGPGAGVPRRGAVSGDLLVVQVGPLPEGGSG